VTPARALTHEDEMNIAAQTPEDGADALLDPATLAALDQADEVEDDEDEADEEDEEDEDEDEDEDERAAAPLPPLRPPPRARQPAKPRGPATRGPSARDRRNAEEAAQILASPLSQPPLPTVTEMKQNADDLSDMLSGFDFATNRHSIIISRVQPEYDGEGHRIAGYLKEYKQPISLEDIRRVYGGGLFQVLVRGPSARMPNRTVLLSNRRYEIVGDPIPVKDPAATARAAAAQATNTQAKTENANLALVQEALGTQGKMVERVYEENRQLKDVILTKLNAPAPDSPFKDLIPFLTAGPDKIRQEMQEERREQREAARLEREAQKELARMEREERQREREEDRRKYEQERDERNRKHEKEMEILRLEMKAARDDQKGAGKEQMMLMQKLDADKARQAQESQQFMMGMMQENAKQLATQLQQFDGMKTKFLMDAVSDARAHRQDDIGTMMDRMVQMKQLVGVLTGQEEKEGWERALEKVSEVAPGLMAAAGQWGKNAPPAPQAAPGRPAPGSVAMVDLPHPGPRRLRPPGARKKLPPGVTPGGLSGGLAAAALPAPAEAPLPPPPAFPSNPMKTFVVPASGTDIEEAVRLLVSNIDLAMQQGYPPERIYEEIVRKFPSEVLALLKKVDVATCVNVISQQAPETWVIASPKGVQVVERLHALVSGAK